MIMIHKFATLRDAIIVIGKNIHYFLLKKIYQNYFLLTLNEKKLSLRTSIWYKFKLIFNKKLCQEWRIFMCCASPYATFYNFHIDLTFRNFLRTRFFLSDT